MLFGFRFPRLRLVIVGLALLAQVYLFVRIRRAILSSNRSERFKTGAIRLVGTAFIVLFGLNAYLLFVHVPWVDPPFIAQASSTPWPSGTSARCFRACSSC